MSEDCTLVTIRVYENAVKAHHAKNHLENEGLASYLFDEHINNLYPLYATAEGGIKLKVKDCDVELAEKSMEAFENQGALDEGI